MDVPHPSLEPTVLHDYLPTSTFSFKFISQPIVNPTNKSLNPGVSAHLKQSHSQCLVFLCPGPYLVILTTLTVVKLQGVTNWVHLSQLKGAKLVLPKLHLTGR